MSSLSIQQRAYTSTSVKPITTFEIYEPMISTALSATSIAGSILAKVAFNSNLWALGFSALAALPGLVHGTQVYTDWIPKMGWYMPKGEIIRLMTGVPDVKRGLAGWEKDSSHSNHFDKNLADGLVGLVQDQGERLKTHADFECGGKGEYSDALKKKGMISTGFDFSQAAVTATSTLKLAKMDESESSEQYDLVTSFGDVMSKTTMGREGDFVKKLVSATKPGGIIAMSCAIPSQPGPNSNCQTNEAVIHKFEAQGCRYNHKATMKLRRLANPMHVWLKYSIMVFDKPS